MRSRESGAVARTDRIAVALSGQRPFSLVRSRRQSFRVVGKVYRNGGGNAGGPAILGDVW